MKQSIIFCLMMMSMMTIYPNAKDAFIQVSADQVYIDGYIFLPNKDYLTDQNFIGSIGPNFSLRQLANYCNTLQGCVGFTTGGFVKIAIGSPIELGPYGGTDPSQGLYVKIPSSSIPQQTYKFYPNKDSINDHYSNLPGLTLDQMKAYCDSNPFCGGYNTDNWWMPSILHPVNEWSSFGSTPTEGMYVKDGFTVDGYTFYSQLDSDGGSDRQIAGQSPQEYKKSCDQYASCLGFNTDGFFKDSLNKFTNFSSFGSKANEGIYLKKGTVVSPSPYYYSFYPNKDSGSNDITNLPQRTLDEVRTYCDATPSCAGYNTDNWVKTTIRPSNEWSSFGTASTEGLYVKSGLILDGYTFCSQLDSYGGDYKQYTGSNPQFLKVLCDRDALCLGFNTGGVLKSSLKKYTEFTSSGSDANQGIYLKKGTVVSPSSYYYNFYPNKDATGNYSTNLPNRTLDEVRTFCDATPSCAGYNTDNWLRNFILPTSQWSSLGSSATEGSYVKAGMIVDGYKFFSAQDSPSGDIRQIPNLNPQQLKALCDSDTSCLGFNTAGSLKKYLTKYASFSSLSTNATEGIYLKKGTTNPSQYYYKFYQNKESGSNDISNLPNRTLDEVRTYCDANPSCAGYNTDNWVKNAILSTSQWSSLGSTATEGLYVKAGVIVDGYNFFSGQDSTQGDIRQILNQTPQQLKALCDNDPSCLGFNTDGRLKSSIKKYSSGSFGSSPNQGIYLKKGTTSPPKYNYSFYQNKDSESYDLTTLPKRTLDEMRTFCDASPSCAGYNSDNIVKSSIRPANEWVSYIGGATEGLYVKGTLIA